MSLVGLASYLTLVCFLSYFLVADDIFKRKLVRNASATISGKKITVTVLESIGTQIERFILVQLLTSALVGVVTAIALWSIGLKNAAVWGLASGVLNSIPYFGPFIVTCALAVIAFLQFGTLGATASVTGVALVITALEGWIITPLLLGRAASMNHVALFAGLLFWTWMWGLWGTLLAAPMMMVLKSVCDHVEDFAPIADFLASETRLPPISHPEPAEVCRDPVSDLESDSSADSGQDLSMELLTGSKESDSWRESGSASNS